MSNILHVAVAVIINEENKVCISLRHQDAHQGGLWEFPGGKIEPTESPEQALVREIKEELNLDIEHSRRLIEVTHDYMDKSVCLHVYKVSSYQGFAKGIEGQRVKWVSVSDLLNYKFPAANLAIIKTLQLPDRYLITGNFTSYDDFLFKLKRSLNKKVKLVQLRLKSIEGLEKDELQPLLEDAIKLCRLSGAKLMLNLSANLTNLIDLTQLDFDGFHFDSRTLKLLLSNEIELPIKVNMLAASCHNKEELQMAKDLDLDFVVLSPVRVTASHPDMEAMGWHVFSELIKPLSIPVYALGGVTSDDISTAWQFGAQGVAGISAFWE